MSERMLYPNQCCGGYCVRVFPEDADFTSEDGMVHDLREDQAARLIELLDRAQEPT